MSQVLNDRRISQTHPLMTPAKLKETLPLLPNHADVIDQGRQTIADILDGKDERLLVIVGPCSVHDPKACIEYAEKLSELKDRHPKSYETSEQVMNGFSAITFNIHLKSGHSAPHGGGVRSNQQ